MSWVDSRYFLEGVDAAGNQTFGTLDGYLDLNLGVDYRISKVLSTFVQINNATASKYSRWYNYPSYRLGVFAGLSYSF
jgi:outer membrane cobalamin receptor